MSNIIWSENLEKYAWNPDNMIVTENKCVKDGLLSGTFASILILSICLAMPCLVIAASPEEKDIKNVLVVNSYHSGYEWSDSIMQGIQSVLGDNNFNVHIEYLDSKRHDGEIYYKYLEDIIRYKYSNAKIDAMIVSDHHAYNLMLEMRKTFQADVPLIFCGLDRVYPENIADYQPIYGVVEGDGGIRSTLDLILSIHPGIRKIFFIADETTSAGVMLSYVRDFEFLYKEVTFDYLINMSADELKAALKNVPQNSVVMWVHFIKDKNGKVFTVAESRKYVVNNVSVPVYVVSGFNTDTGVLGGSINDGFVQGEKAAQIALELLNKNRVPDPFYQQVSSINIFDYRVMKRFNIGINDVPENSIIYNQPFAGLKEHRWQIIGIIILIIFQMLLISILMINLKKRKDGEKSLRASEERFRATFEQAAVGIAHVSPEGRFLRINRKFCEIVGYTSEEMLDLMFQEITHPDDLDADVAHINELLAGGIDTYSMEKRYIRKDGEFVWIHLTVSLIRDEPGVPQWFVGVVKDITERKQAEVALRESEQKFRDLIDQSPTVFELYDKDGVLMQVNPAFEKLWNLSGNDVVGKFNVFKSDQVKEKGLLPYFERAFEGEFLTLPDIEFNASMEEVSNREKSRKRYLSSILYPVKNIDGNVTHVVMMHEDITEGKHAEEEIQRLQEEYTHIARVSAMGELSASLAHELKQPLAAIRSNAQAALRFLTGDKPDIDELHEVLKDIIADNRRADDVIGKLRKLMQKSQIQIIELNMKELVLDILPLITSHEAMRQISLQLELDETVPLVAGDRVQVQQVILNLILNSTEALINTNAESRSIIVRTCQQDTQTVTLSVEDNGPGIEAKVIPHLFDAFYTTKQQGLGMGLAISRSIIEEHGGRLWAENNPDHGATFYFTIPIIREESA